MPRTKHVRNRAKSANDTTKEYDMRMQTFDRCMQACVAKLERDTQSAIKSFETSIDVMVTRLPMEIRQMTLGEIFGLQNRVNEEENQNNESILPAKNYMQPPPVPKMKVNKTVKRVTNATSDDGYATEGTASSDNTSWANRGQLPIPTMRRTRSATRLSKIKLNEINQKIMVTKFREKNESSCKTNTPIYYKTPMTLKPQANVYDVVTPKVKPNTPLNVLRRPRQGEMVLSMQGSPLLVSAVIEEKTANINVPLSNGNVMSLLPQEGLRISNIPDLDPETMHQLETLKNHIEKVIGFK